MKADPNITAKILLHSRNELGQEIVTSILTFPRIILAEFNTHRTLSRNSASSRAIPIPKQLAKVSSNPFVPVLFGKNQKGMQASTEIEDSESAKEIWLNARDGAVNHATCMKELGIHKQIANRLVEPWLYTTVICTATSGLHNLFALRAHKDAQPEFQVLAYRWLDALLASEPTDLASGEWHIPFGDRMPEGTDLEGKKKIATARCARVSYETFDGEININSDLDLHDSLAASGHWSPFEHVAMATSEPIISGNFRGGWMQYRSFFSNECRTKKDTDLKLILANKPDWI